MRKKIILLIIVLLLSIFMVGAVNASSNDSMVSSSKVTNSISSISDTGDVDISNVKNSGVKEANNILKKVNSKKIVVSKNNINHTKSETTSSSKSESYKDSYDDDDYDDDVDGYEDYIDGYDDDYEYELVHDAYIKSKKVHYSVNTSINFGWNGNFKGYFKVYKGKKQLYSYYLEGYNGRYTYNPHLLSVGEYTTKLISDNKTIAKGKIIVKKVPSKISVNSFKIYSGIKFNYYVYVFNKKDNTYLNEGYVKFKINGKTYKAKVKKGEAKIKIKIPKKIGTYICKAQYYGGKNSENSKKVKFKMVVKKKPKNMVIYEDWCHGEIKHTHKAIWTKKHDGNAYIGIVYKNGHKYKKYIKLYTFICVCGKNKNHKPWLESHDGDKYYSYESYGTDTPEKYIYKKIW